MMRVSNQLASNDMFRIMSTVFVRPIYPADVI